MSKLRAFYAAAVGKKIIMALTGGILGLFVTQHVLGVLTAFQSPGTLNTYAFFLKSKPGIVWPVRLILLTALLLHIRMAYDLTVMSRATRPVGYQDYRPQSSTTAARTMRVGGVVLALFIVFHILHLTTGTILHGQYVATDVYGNVVRGFSIWWVSAIYIGAMVVLGAHLYHGVWSSFQTLGFNHPHLNNAWRRLAQGLAVFIYAGFIAVPVAVLVGILK